MGLAEESKGEKIGKTNRITKNIQKIKFYQKKKKKPKKFEATGKKEDREGSCSVLTNQVNIKINNCGWKNNISHQQR